MDNPSVPKPKPKTQTKIKTHTQNQTQINTLTTRLHLNSIQSFFPKRMPLGLGLVLGLVLGFFTKENTDIHKSTVFSALSSRLCLLVSVFSALFYLTGQVMVGFENSSKHDLSMTCPDGLMRTTGWYLGSVFRFGLRVMVRVKGQGWGWGSG